MTNAPPDFAIRAAVSAALQSPCAKSKRGAVIVEPAPRAAPSGWIWGVGFNGQPEPFVCTGSAACAAACGQLCLHAEQRAIIAAVAANPARYEFARLARLDLVHVKVVGGELVPGGGPSCWQCSREILDVGLAAVWLYERTWSTCGSDSGCCYCEGACRECDIAETCGNSRDVCSPEHNRHYGLAEKEPRWRRYTAEEFHRATAAHHGFRLETR